MPDTIWPRPFLWLLSSAILRASLSPTLSWNWLWNGETINISEKLVIFPFYQPTTWSVPRQDRNVPISHDLIPVSRRYFTVVNRYWERGGVREWATAEIKMSNPVGQTLVSNQTFSYITFPASCTPTTWLQGSWTLSLKRMARTKTVTLYIPALSATSFMCITYCKGWPEMYPLSTMGNQENNMCHCIF